jgi:predicted  nucleic acid-binding Zn-ribbon protein
LILSQAEATALTRRFFVFSFGATPESLNDFYIQKRGGVKLYPSFLYAGFNKEGEFMECHMEFAEGMRDAQLVTQLEEFGNSQVVVATYPANDNNQAVLAALERITEQIEEKGHIQFMRGEQPRHLEMLTAVHNTLTAKKKEKLSKQEFDEKTQAVISMQTEKLDEIGERAVKIEQGVCGVIPDYQKEIQSLKQKLTHKTTEVDRIEYVMSRKTLQINQLKKEIEDLQSNLTASLQCLEQARKWELMAFRMQVIWDQFLELSEENRALKRQRGEEEPEELV